ncbi:MAG: indolepyruvate ferredoxin oxidoreductase subunit alpha [Candidatus Odinarchaeota archaeon]|nr:indolepyruvate ferredoxin oxidoreductase subunit alpha [Candidatus Odinarchaeota archaeon]
MTKIKKIVSTPPGEKIILLGNEAIARGAIEAGIGVASTYPGTPASEIGDTLYHLSYFYNFHFEYAVNEIVALEIAAAAAISNIRSLVSMKHVGLNVAADAFMTLAYVGVNAGMVIVSADDPFAYSSQNEQDNRHYGIFAGIPVIEPSNPQEAKDFTKIAFEVSEKLKEPVLLRTTTRVSHMSAPVTLGEIIKRQETPKFIRDVKRFVPVPAHARELHKRVLENLEKAKKISEEIEINRLIINENSKIAVIASGIAINYVLDSMKRLRVGMNVLALGMTHPLPENKIVNFLTDNKDKEILIVEELDPIVEDQVKRIAYEHKIPARILGKRDKLLPMYHELNPDIVTFAISKILKIQPPINLEAIEKIRTEIISKIPRRPPVMCAGCPHRATYFAVKKALDGKDAIFTTDIGCYTLGIMPPYQIGDVLLCMGSSIGMANSFSEIFKNEKPVLAFIGDSTFFHAGLPALANGVHNGHKFIVTIMDNSTTAMTGHQPTLNIEYQLRDRKTKSIKIEDVVASMGIKNVKVVNSFVVKKLIDAYKEALEYDGISVIISRGKCILVTLREMREKGQKVIPFEVIPEKCTGCRTCVDELNCPAILWKDDRAQIDPFLCSGCGVCAQICPYHAIRRRMEHDNDT